MPLSDPASVFYKPTALEQAYAIYVYEKLFGRFPAGGRLYLESKTALPLFAQKSGVNTLFLRSIWTVADPDNRKYLDNVAQFHVLLRLIALCQDGLLEQEINKAFNEERGQTTPAAVMKRTLWMSSDYDDCPLPKFEGVTIPSDETLKRFHERLKGSSSTSPVPAPAPSPIPIKSPSALPAVQIRKTPAPAPIPVSKPSPKKASTKGSNKREENIQSAITQIESLSVNNVSSVSPSKFNIDSPFVLPFLNLIVSFTLVE